VTPEMSPDDRVALVQRTWDAYNAGEVDSAHELFHPEVEVYASPELANPGTFRGVEALLRWIATWNEAWESFHFGEVETVPVGEHHAVTRMHQTGIGRGSGVEVSMEVGWLYEIRDRRCVHLGLHPSFESALAVARQREGIDETSG
jgi:ketosteroid isomerase-like protein